MRLLHLCLCLSIGIFIASNSQATTRFSPCSLSKEQIIKIGCTTTCGRFNSWAMRSAARRLGYNIDYENIYSENSSIDISKYDAIIIPGGVDINPKYYTPYVEPELRAHIENLYYLVDFTTSGKQRDTFEYNLLENYFNNNSLRDTPILGICRGMQMLTVSQRIPLYVDIKKELNIKNRRYTLDKIYVTKRDSALFDSVRKDTFRGVEIHHQGLRLDYFLQHKDRWPNLEVTSVSNGGKIAESLEFKDRPVLGVQFHPEYTFGKVRKGVFDWFLNQACHKKNKDLFKK